MRCALVALVALACLALHIHAAALQRTHMRTSILQRVRMQAQGFGMLGDSPYVEYEDKAGQKEKWMCCCSSPAKEDCLWEKNADERKTCRAASSLAVKPNVNPNTKNEGNVVEGNQCDASSGENTKRFEKQMPAYQKAVKEAVDAALKQVIANHKKKCGEGKKCCFGVNMEPKCAATCPALATEVPLDADGMCSIEAWLNNGKAVKAQLEQPANEAATQQMRAALYEHSVLDTCDAWNKFIDTHSEPVTGAESFNKAGGVKYIDFGKHPAVAFHGGHGPGHNPNLPGQHLSHNFQLTFFSRSVTSDFFFSGDKATATHYQKDGHLYRVPYFGDKYLVVSQDAIDYLKSKNGGVGVNIPVKKYEMPASNSKQTDEDALRVLTSKTSFAGWMYRCHLNPTGADKVNNANAEIACGGTTWPFLFAERISESPRTMMEDAFRNVKNKEQCPTFPKFLSLILHDLTDVAEAVTKYMVDERQKPSAAAASDLERQLFSRSVLPRMAARLVGMYPSSSTATDTGADSHTGSTTSKTVTALKYIHGQKLPPLKHTPTPPLKSQELPTQTHSLSVKKTHQAMGRHELAPITGKQLHHA